MSPKIWSKVRILIFIIIKTKNIFFPSAIGLLNTHNKLQAVTKHCRYLGGDTKNHVK